MFKAFFRHLFVDLKKTQWQMVSPKPFYASSKCCKLRAGETHTHPSSSYSELFSQIFKRRDILGLWFSEFLNGKSTA
jgi:hypothetical protein